MSSLASKLIVITGGTKGGLGYEAAKLLLTTTSHRIILTLRDENKAKKALSGLEQASSGAMHRVSTVLLDLLSTESVIRAADEIKLKSNRSIDALILNAAIVPVGSSGHDAYRVNHLSQMMLTHLLLPSLMTKQSTSSEEGEKEEEANIVVVSSALHSSLAPLVPSPSYFRDRAPDSIDPKATSLRLYSLTKLYNLWFTYKLHRILQERQSRNTGAVRGVRVNALSPGFIPNTNLSASQGFLAHTFMTYVMPLAPFATRKEDGAKSLVDLALWSISTQEAKSGLYFTKGQVKESSPLSRDEALQDELWAISCKALEISDKEEDFGSG